MISKSFSPHVWYFAVGDFLSIAWESDVHHIESLTPSINLVYSEDNRVVGCHVFHVTRLMTPASDTLETTQFKTLEEFVEWMKISPQVPFVPHAYYDPDGDMMEVYWSSEPCYHVQPNYQLSIAYSEETNEVVGCQVYSISKMLGLKKYTQTFVDFQKRIDDYRAFQNELMGEFYDSPNRYLPDRTFENDGC